MSIAPEHIKAAFTSGCAEARKWMGATSPNPPVGAVALDANGTILAIAAHQHAGEAHAEAILIDQCRAQNNLTAIHTLCVTMEPCNHQGRTPPCTEAIIAAGIKNVIIGTRDPNPHVAGGGVERLQQAGINVTLGILKDECEQLIHAFMHKAKTGKPWVTVKRALDANGSMIPPVGATTFTTPDSLLLAHRLRKKSDAILTGSGTILTDNPLFTVRHVKDYMGKRRWLGILDRRRRVPQSYIDAARQRGLDAFIYQDVTAALADLAQKGASDILVEAGPAVSQAVFDSLLWTMSVTIRHDKIDIIGVEFNKNEPISFDTNAFRWDFMLPA